MQRYKKYTNNASFLHFFAKKFGHIKKKQYFCTRFREESYFFDYSSEAASPDWRETALGAIAQLVEQRTENPCVTGSIPVGTTQKKETQMGLFFVPIGNLTRGLISHTVLERLLL